MIVDLDKTITGSTIKLSARETALLGKLIGRISTQDVGKLLDLPSTCETITEMTNFIDGLYSRLESSE